MHYLIYNLNGEEYIKELGQIVKIEDNDVELSVKFTRGYLSTAQRFLKDKMREVCKKIEADIDMEMTIYKRLHDVFDGAFDPTFWEAAKHNVTNKYQIFVHSIKSS